MKKIIKQTPLYRFLEYCQENISEAHPKILDCGAGGNCPPLSLFAEHGFETTGIDLDAGQIKKAQLFGNDNGQTLNIQWGDMTALDFEDESFDCVYSYNSVFHMKKVDVLKAISEMKRVLKPGGMFFVNFLSVDDFRCGEGPHLGNQQYEQMDDEPVIHSYYELNEADAYFEEMKFVLKERRVIERIYEGEKIKQGFIDYIVQKV